MKSWNELRFEERVAFARNYMRNPGPIDLKVLVLQLSPHTVDSFDIPNDE
jgi:hypothetical protein